MAGLRRSKDAEIADLKAQLAKTQEKPAEARPPKPGNGESADEPGWGLDWKEQAKLGRITGKHGLSDFQIDKLDRLMQVERPDDIGTWAEEVIQGMGWVKPELQLDETPPKEQPPSAKSDQGPPASATSWEDKRSPLEWSKEDVDRILREKGIHKGRRFIREQMEQFLQGVVIVPPPRGS